MDPRLEAFSSFSREQFPRIFGMLTLYTGNPDLAEELAQEALVRALARWDQVRSLDQPEAWIYRVALNLANSYFRRARAERAALARSRYRNAPSDAADDGVAIRDAVRRLPRRCREALILRYFADLSVDEAALVMDCSARTVKRLSSKALSLLRDMPDVIWKEASIEP